jgi:hypothetical protein
VDRSWKYINRSQTHECGIGAEARLFPEKEYINGIAVAVWGWRVSFTCPMVVSPCLRGGYRKAGGQHPMVCTSVTKVHMSSVYLPLNASIRIDISI